MTTALPDVTRRSILAGGAALAAATALPRSGLAAAPATILNDASGLNATQVAQHTVLRTDAADTLIARYRSILDTARAAGQPVCAAGARHSMGGQSLASASQAITLDHGGISIDTARKTCRIVAGARWRDVITALNAHGLSPAIMQSNNDFSVASTFCVNAHGWAVPHGPFGTSVRQVRMILADGSLVVCSPTENRTLFQHALGGYGLFGLIVDLDLDVTDDIDLDAQYERIDAERLGSRFCEIIDRDPTIAMAYARLDVTRGDFLHEAQITTYRRAVHQSGVHNIGNGRPAFIEMARNVYRAQTVTDLATRFRWFAETEIGSGIGGRHPTRNQLVNTSLQLLENRSAARTDILHEYFVAPDRFSDFLAATRTIMAGSNANLLNITVRLVEPDPHSVLAYAPKRRLAAVMAFSQKRTAAGESDMRRITESFIDQVLALGGSYYLPYRLHARHDQIARAYPNWENFIAHKSSYDPEDRFQNGLWQRYGRA